VISYSQKIWDGTDRDLNHCTGLTRPLEDTRELRRSSVQKEASWEKARAELNALKEKAERSKYPSS
jgi:hypothetical protein